LTEFYKQASLSLWTRLCGSVLARWRVLLHELLMEWLLMLAAMPLIY